MDNREKRTSGVYITYNAVPIYWASKKQTAVTGEICEGELYALNYGLKSAIPLRNILCELEFTEEKQIMVYCDKKSTSDISAEGLKKNSKHYSLQLLYINDFIERKEAVTKSISGRSNVADMLTKFQDYDCFKNQFQYLCLKKTQK